MKRKIITTKDGSKTIQIEDWNEQYHSVHGAINEANHVFIKHGLLFYLDKKLESDVISSAVEKSQSEISILEIGFGTGLNAFLTLLKAEELKQPIRYVGVEAYPVIKEEITELNYTELISKENEAFFDLMHQTEWEVSHKISEHFILKKEQKLFREIIANEEFDIIYFDAFGARVQPELWTEEIFKLMFNALKPNGVLTTYSAKGSVRRAMQAVGFTVERLPGPPGKREMLRALKSSQHSTKFTS